MSDELPVNEQSYWEIEYHDPVKRRRRDDAPWTVQIFSLDVLRDTISSLSPEATIGSLKYVRQACWNDGMRGRPIRHDDVIALAERQAALVDAAAKED